MKLTVYKKMMLGFSVIISIMIISSAYVLFELNTVSNGAKNILTSNIRIQELAGQLKAIIQDENGYARKYFVSNDETYFSLFVETSKQVDLNLKLLLEREYFNEDRSIINGMQNVHNSFVAGMREKENKKTAPDARRLEKMRYDTMAFLLDSLDILIAKNQFSIGEEMGRIESITARSVRIALLLIAGTLFSAITAALIITRTITRPIGDLIKGTRLIGRGDFKKIIVSSHDEIALLADAVNDMSAKIKNINELRTQTMQQISHELKTPLQAIQSAHDILVVSGTLNDGQFRMLDVINRSIEKLANFSRQYLDLAKIESGVVQYNLELYDLLKVVKPVVDEAKLVAESKNVKIELNSEKIPSVMIDIEKVSIVVSNLISNAIKYTREDGTIIVSIRPIDTGVQITVKDSGIGINSEEIPNVFTRFYQASNITKIKSNGSGVGLAIVKAYTEGHGGKVYVKSILDKGSTFKVEIPIETRQVSRTLENLIQ